MKKNFLVITLLVILSLNINFIYADDDNSDGGTSGDEGFPIGQDSIDFYENVYKNEIMILPDGDPKGVWADYPFVYGRLFDYRKDLPPRFEKLLNNTAIKNVMFIMRPKPFDLDFTNFNDHSLKGYVMDWEVIMYFSEEEEVILNLQDYTWEHQDCMFPIKKCRIGFINPDGRILTNNLSYNASMDRYFEISNNPQEYTSLEVHKQAYPAAYLCLSMPHLIDKSNGLWVKDYCFILRGNFKDQFGNQITGSDICFDDPRKESPIDSGETTGEVTGILTVLPLIIQILVFLMGCLIVLKVLVKVLRIFLPK